MRKLRKLMGWKPKLFFLFALCITCKIANLRCRNKSSRFRYHVRNAAKTAQRGSVGVSYEPEWSSVKGGCRWRSVCKHNSSGFLGPQTRPDGSCQGEARRARLSLPLSVRAGQWRWGRWRGRGRGRCRGLLGRGLRERRHINTSADSETKSSPGRQPLGTPLDGRMPLQVGGSEEWG